MMMTTADIGLLLFAVLMITLIVTGLLVTAIAHHSKSTINQQLAQTVRSLADNQTKTTLAVVADRSRERELTAQREVLWIADRDRERQAQLQQIFFLYGWLGLAFDQLYQQVAGGTRLVELPDNSLRFQVANGALYELPQGMTPDHVNAMVALQAVADGSQVSGDK